MGAGPRAARSRCAPNAAARGLATAARSESVGSRRLLEVAAAGDVHDTRLYTAIAEATGARGNTTALVGTAEQVAESLLAYVDLGITTILLRGFDPLEDAREYAAIVEPRARRGRPSRRAWRPEALRALEHGGEALAAADAHRDEAAPRSGPLERVHQLHRQDRAGRTDRMAERDRAAVGIQLLGGSCSVSATATACAANASFSSMMSMSSIVLPASSSAFGIDCAGA